MRTSCDATLAVLPSIPEALDRSLAASAAWLSVSLIGSVRPSSAFCCWTNSFPFRIATFSASFGPTADRTEANRGA